MSPHFAPSSNIVRVALCLVMVARYVVESFQIFRRNSHALPSSPPIPGVPLHANLDDWFPRQSFFHVDCFKCAKCDNRVAAGTDLLLLSSGLPICAGCSYRCYLCERPIVDEAIVETNGAHSYHAQCFRCKVCDSQIDELVFAKTSRGIYCMDCHNERVARGRRHQAKQQERERTAALQQQEEQGTRTAEVRSRLVLQGPVRSRSSRKFFEDWGPRTGQDRLRK